MEFLKLFTMKASILGMNVGQKLALSKAVILSGYLVWGGCLILGKELCKHIAQILPLLLHWAYLLLSLVTSSF